MTAMKPDPIKGLEWEKYLFWALHLDPILAPDPCIPSNSFETELLAKYMHVFAAHYIWLTISRKAPLKTPQ